MHVRCPYCRHSFNLSRDFMAQALAESKGKKLKYHSVECINCRKTIKVPYSQMRRYVPEDQIPAEEPATSED